MSPTVVLAEAAAASTSAIPAAPRTATGVAPPGPWRKAMPMSPTVVLAEAAAASTSAIPAAEQAAPRTRAAARPVLPPGPEDAVL